MKELINELREQLGKFFEIIPGYFSFKREIFNLIEKIESYDTDRQRDNVCYEKSHEEQTVCSQND